MAPPYGHVMMTQKGTSRNSCLVPYTLQPFNPSEVFQDEFTCPVCLDLLKDPVTIQCGHSYCMSCITDCLNEEDDKRVYSCPQCRQTFSPRPALARNTMLNHLEQHESWFKGKRHSVIEATGRLQEMICQKHEKLLEVFCRTDQKCICVLCTVTEHKNHDTVSAADQRTEKQVFEHSFVAAVCENNQPIMVKIHPLICFTIPINHSQSLRTSDSRFSLHTPHLREKVLPICDALCPISIDTILSEKQQSVIIVFLL
uniref:RING-type domain-containing protein n=1 Tax=Sinocyclocheilus grahami TaxID=75366 RepID=A0A672L9F1_SINGR